MVLGVVDSLWLGVDLSRERVSKVRRLGGSKTAWGGLGMKRRVLVGPERRRVGVRSGGHGEMRKAGIEVRVDPRIVGIRATHVSVLRLLNTCGETGDP